MILTNMIRKALQDYFSELENKVEQAEEFSIGDKIAQVLNVRQEKLTDSEELAEFMAFQFMPDYHNKDTSWGTYYGPMMVMKNDQDQFVEFPSIKPIDDQMIVYWRKRFDEVNNPILAYRYADLVFDFEPRISKKSIDFQVAQKIIDRGIEICEKNLSDDLGSKQKMARCIALAIQINDCDRIKKLVETIIATEDKYTEDDKPGLWGYAFHWLILNKSDKVTLTEDQKAKLLKDLEDRLQRLSSAEDPDAWRIEHAVSLLAEYYVVLKDKDNLERVLNVLEASFRKNKYANSDGLLITNYLEKLIEIYSKYASFDFAKVARQRIVTELSNLGDRGKFATTEIATEIKVSNEEIKKYLDAIFGTEKTEKLEKIIAKIAVNFVLPKNQVETQLNNLAKDHPLMFLVGHVIMSEDGYPIVKFDSVNDDYDKHLLENFSKNLHFQAFFFRMVMDRLRSDYTPEQVLETIIASPVFKADDKEYVLKLLKSFWNKDYLVTSCLGIPLIEDMVRNLYRINNQSYIKTNKEGGYDVHNLDTLIGAGLIKASFQSMGENLEYYLKVLLTERAGWNLRNNFAHGISKKEFASEDIAGRILHVLLCFSIIRKKE